MSSALIIDDSADSRLVARVLLEAEGFDTIEADDGESALALLESGERPDVVLLDLRMPKVDGFEFLERVRSRPDLARIPVVVVSAYADLIESERLARGPDRPVVLKPFLPDVFMDAVRSVRPRPDHTTS